MKPDYQQYLDLALSRKKENRKLLQKLKKIKPKVLDKIINTLHDEAFEFIDCLQCANCCKSISPSIQDNDIQKIAKTLRIKPSAVVHKYMHIDEEQDYVMNVSPCPFLRDDNYCEIYESRPLACKGYPHTDRNKINQLLDLTLKNTLICPAVSYIFEELKKTV
jgi:Fe-S-cluster containining protein